MFARCFLLIEGERKIEASVDLRESKTSSGTAGGSLLLPLRTAENNVFTRIPSHLVPSWHRFRDSAFKLGLPRLRFLRGQTRQPETYAHIRPASFSYHLTRARFLEPYPFLASGLHDGCHPLGTLSTATLAASLVRKSRRRQAKVEACRFAQHTSFQEARVRWSHRRRAVVVYFPTITVFC